MCVLGVSSGFSFILDLVSVPDLVSVFLVSVPDLVLYWIWFRSRIWFVCFWLRFRIWFFNGFGFGPGFDLCVLRVGSRFGFIVVLVSVPDLVCVFLVSVSDFVL